MTAQPGAEQSRPPASDAARGAAALGAATTGIGAAVLTVVAGACCVSPILAPLIVGILGASGAVWAAGLKPYGWWILGGSAMCLAFGFWSVYRPRRDCEIGEAPRSGRIMQRIAKGSLWVGAIFWVAGMTVRLVLPS